MSIESSVPGQDVGGASTETLLAPEHPPASGSRAGSPGDDGGAPAGGGPVPGSGTGSGLVTPPDGSRRWWVRGGVVASSALTAWLLVRGGSPGWMTTDSRNMMYQARGRSPYSDWYSPILEWFWSHLGATTTGPLVPHLLQVLAYSAGILLASLAVARRHPVLGIAVPWLMLVNPAMWTLHYIWRDSYMAAVMVLVLGAGLWLRDTRAAAWSFVPVGVLSGLAAVSRPYLLPLMMILAWVLSWPAGRRGWLRSLAGAVLAAVAGVAIAVLLPRIVIPEIQATRAGEAVFAFDALTIDCEHEWAGKERPRPAVSPPGLWRDPDTLCTDAGFGEVGKAWAAGDAPNDPPALDLAGWWTIARANLDTVIGGRLQHAILLMTQDPSRNLDVDEGRLITTPGVMGRGAEWGYPSDPGVEIVVLAALAAFTPPATGLWILSSAVLAVIGAALRRIDRRLLALGLWSLLGALVQGLLAPATDYRYVAPFAITSWLVSLVLVAQVSRVPEPAGSPGSAAAAST